MFMAMVRKWGVMVWDLLRDGGRVALKEEVEGLFLHGGATEGEVEREREVRTEACDGFGGSASSHFDWA